MKADDRCRLQKRIEQNNQYQLTIKTNKYGIIQQL